MKKTTILCICLSLSVTVMAMAPGNSAQSDNGFNAFWKKFQTAAISSDKETIVGLSRFPIRMPGRERNIKDAADLRLRYREVFNRGFNPAQCFGEKYMNSKKLIEASQDSDNPKIAYFECFDTKGYQFVYRFELTNIGWKFVRLNKSAYDEG